MNTAELLETYRSPTRGTPSNIILHPNGLVQRADYQGKLSKAELQKIVENYPIYKSAADEAGIPWQMLAAVHYRENSLKTTCHVKGGPFQFTPPRHQGEEDFQVGAFMAARFIQEKSGYRLSPGTTDATIIKDAFWGYNGRAKWHHGSPDNSAYVVNRMDDQHQEMHIKWTESNKETGEKIHRDVVDQRLGAYPFYLELMEAFQ